MAIIMYLVAIKVWVGCHIYDVLLTLLEYVYVCVLL
jgi:hypothetical protein